jgi:hypothetical protein
MFRILCGTVPLIIVAIAVFNGPMVDWDATTPLLIVCFEVIAVSILSALREHRQEGSCFWKARANEPPDDWTPDAATVLRHRRVRKPYRIAVR